MKYFAMFLLVGSLSGTAFAAAPSVASIEKLLTVTQSEKIVDQVFENLDGFMKGVVDQSVKQNGMDEQGRLIMDNFMVRMVKVMKQELSWENTKPIYVQVYGENFTQKEIDDLLIFYATPTGKALIEKMPAVMNKSMELTQARIAPMMQRIQQEMKQAIDEVKAARQNENEKTSK